MPVSAHWAPTVVSLEHTPRELSLEDLGRSLQNQPSQLGFWAPPSLHGTSPGPPSGALSIHTICLEWPLSPWSWDLLPSSCP